MENTHEKTRQPVKSEAEQIYQIFDKTFKKILTLSTKSVINLINGLFHTDYSTDSEITYNWTEFEDDKLKKILADTIITINGRFSYHLEAQMEKDNSIVFRVFEYGFSHANRNRVLDSSNHNYILPFPRPVVIYLYYEGSVPDTYTLTLEFEEGKISYDYTVPVVKLPDMPVEELNARNMIILIPFHILKLRRMLNKESNKPVEVQISELQRIVKDDIIGSIDENLRIGNITLEDANKLKRYLLRLCDYLSTNYTELEVLRDMTDESYMTDVDIYYEKLHALEDAIAEKENALAEKDELIAQLKVQLAQYTQQPV